LAATLLKLMHLHLLIDDKVDLVCSLGYG